jgi:hypothetical protein
MLIWLGRNCLGQKQNPELESAIDPLKDLVAEYRKRYELLIREREERPATEAEAAAKLGSKKKKKVAKEETK